MENTVRTTHNLAAVLFDTAVRLNNKADTIASNVEYRGEQPCPSAGIDAPPSAANDVLNRAIDHLLRLETTLDRIHESVGSVYQPDPSAKQVGMVIGASASNVLTRR